MEFIKNGATLPVPFNIIPMPNVVYKLVKKLRRKFLAKRDAQINNANHMAMMNGRNGKLETGIMAMEMNETQMVNNN
jgi:hypothetical protein